ncbi:MULTISPECIES: ABC transporter ATP-binding protein [unclassified Brevibacterium]|uniref:ABC transporter ATP-binding protein n=1 Tax=unclassified Brevibacterium TaxID=2614124 RepID=UPI001E3E459D|nr:MULTISPECIES: ABC transporter ATP-binding protein [unclassified Brevibacterium]MCD1285216.1 branched-chain amino acid ABC transporter ATP-binding protein [Brevibacterium sp. CCUG 69071]MDK8435161.1 ABC transporter ATP-binding protein [Brevibacterium sp. H-BE7]
MLTLENVSTGYDATDALHGVSITAKPGELTVILGANGSGKTTLFKTISGLLRTRSGTITYADRQIGRARPNTIVKRGIAHCPEGRHLFGKMSVEKNLRLGTYPHRNRTRTEEILAEVFELFPILKEKAKQPAGSLSGGQQQMVAIGRALMSDPSLLILDEPSMGLAPLVVEQVLESVAQINSNGIGVLLSEQNAKASLAIAHRGYVLAEGRVVLADDAAKLLDNPQVQAAYLGL